MTARGFYTLLFGSLMLVTALSVGSAGAFLLGTAALCALAVSLISVLLAASSCRITQEMDCEQVTRGDVCLYRIHLRLFAPLPIAPLALLTLLPSGRQTEYLLSTRLLGETVSESSFVCPHVGLCTVGVSRIMVRDCFSLFALHRTVRTPLPQLTVLPNPVPAEKPAFSPGEGEHSISQRALSDLTTPIDTRPWQDGDEMKRVHWKLSMRRQMLMVHTYETPQRPDALILLDCAAPQAGQGHAPFVIDALTEECAGVVKALLSGSHPVRLPLYGAVSREISVQEDKALPDVLTALAQEPFDGDSDFARVLHLASRRMRRTGATVILTSRLTPPVADAAIALSRMGPRTALTLVTDSEPSEAQEQLLYLLRCSGVSARHVYAA